MANTAHGTLTANLITEVVVTSGFGGVVIVNRTFDGGVIWARIDGHDPAIEGPDSYVVIGAREFTLPRRLTFRPTTVRLVSDTARAYSVEAIGA